MHSSEDMPVTVGGVAAWLDQQTGAAEAVTAAVKMSASQCRKMLQSERTAAVASHRGRLEA